jgi:hypothetical protein
MPLCRTHLLDHVDKSDSGQHVISKLGAEDTSSDPAVYGHIESLIDEAKTFIESKLKEAKEAFLG